MIGLVEIEADQVLQDDWLVPGLTALAEIKEWQSLIISLTGRVGLT
jgi:hypothetical protein